MSDLDTRPQEYLSAGGLGRGPEELLLSARRVPLGKTTEVARALPDRQIRMIGAWCFLDHYGPEELGPSPGMQVWAHPPPGHGIVHSEISQPDRPPRLHGVQLWVALPDGVRDSEPRFESYAELPDLGLGADPTPGIRGNLLLGRLA